MTEIKIKREGLVTLLKQCKIYAIKCIQIVPSFALGHFQEMCMV